MFRKASHPLKSIPLVLARRLTRRCLGPQEAWPIIWIDPKRIIYRSPRHGLDMKDRDKTFVIGGPWESGLPTFESHPLYQAIEAHFVNGVPWAETPYYREELRKVGGGFRAHNNCHSLEDIEARWNLLVSMYRSIRSIGILPEEGLPIEQRGGGDILVNITRSGEFVYETGKHRLSLALLLNLEAIPVRVMVRHRRWYRYCLEVAAHPRRGLHVRGGLKEHPDIGVVRSFVLE